MYLDPALMMGFGGAALSLFLSIAGAYDVGAMVVT